MTPQTPIGSDQFDVDERMRRLLDRLDAFIEEEIAPLQSEADNDRFFDHRREFSRTDLTRDGAPSDEWHALLAEMKRRADRAGWLRYGLPSAAGGSDGSHYEMAILREHLARKGLGLHNDLHNESSVVGNFPLINMLLEYGTPDQQAEFVEPILTGSKKLSFALTEPDHGSDATWLESTGAQLPDGSWRLNGVKKFISGLPMATHILALVRTSGERGKHQGISAFLVPTDAPGFQIDRLLWTFNMPTDHAALTLNNIEVPESALFGRLNHGLEVAQSFVHQNRIRQAASGVGVAQYCIERSVDYARRRVTFGTPLAQRQAIQWPLVELHTEAHMLRTFLRQTAALMDDGATSAVSDRVSMCNYRANRLACAAADQAIQVFGGEGYTRHQPFEHIYRHHRRYRITEGSDEIQIRRIAGKLFGFSSTSKASPTSED